MIRQGLQENSIRRNKTPQFDGFGTCEYYVYATWRSTPKTNESSTDFCGRWHSELAKAANVDSMSGHVRFLRIHLSSRAAFAQSVSQSVLPGTLTWPA